MITKSKRSSVPALDSGLDVLEMVMETGQELGFSELLKNLSVSRASASRIIKVLKTRGYLSKDAVTGKYGPGHKLSTIGPNTGTLDSLRLISTGIMESLSRAIGNNTVLLFYKTFDDLIVVNKIQPEHAETMINIGKTVGDFGRNPWGWLFYYNMNREQQKSVLRKISNKKLFKARIKKRSDFYIKNGFTYDNCEIHKQRRRLAAPIFIKNQFIGALGVGGNILEFTDEKINGIGKKLIKHTEQLSSEL